MTDFVVFARFFIEFSRKKGGGGPQARLSSRVPVTSASHSRRCRANLAENPARFFESLHPAESKHVWSHQDAPNVTANPALDWRCLFLLHVSSPFLRAEVSAPVYLLRRTISRISGQNHFLCSGLNSRHNDRITELSVCLRIRYYHPTFSRKTHEPRAFQRC